MRIKSTTLTSLAGPTDGPAPPPERIGPRAARFRETLQNGLYQVNLDKLAERLIAPSRATDEPDEPGQPEDQPGDQPGDVDPPVASDA